MEENIIETKLLEGKQILVIAAFVLFSIFGILGSVFLIWIVEGISEKMKHRKLNNAEESTVGFWASIGGFLVISIAVVLLWTGVILLMPIFWGNPKSVGEAGDMFGSVTALFSGLAFAGLISTLLMQRRELELQRSELQLSRSEFKLQRFESSLFGQIRLFNEYVQSLEFSESINPGYVKIHSGRHALKIMADQVSFANQSSDSPKENYTAYFQVEIEEYERKYIQELEADLGPYFRLLFNVLRYIESADFLNDQEKLEYAKSVRSHLGLSEIKLLAVHCASKHAKGMKNRIIKFRLLKYIDRTIVKNNPALIDEYGHEAFEHRFVQGKIGKKTAHENF